MPNKRRVVRAPNALTIRISNALLRRLKEISRTAGFKPDRAGSLASWVEDVLVATAAEYFSMHIPPTLDVPITGGEAPDQTNDVHKRKLAPEDIQKILFLFDSGQNANTLAKRFHVGASTIRRVLLARKPPIQARPAGPHRRRGNINILFGAPAS